MAFGRREAESEGRPCDGEQGILYPDDFLRRSG